MASCHMMSSSTATTSPSTNLNERPHVTTAQSLTSVLTIDSLDEIPEHQQNSARENTLTSTYFTDG